MNSSNNIPQGYVVESPNNNNNYPTADDYSPTNKKSVNFSTTNDSSANDNNNNSNVRNPQEMNVQDAQVMDSSEQAGKVHEGTPLYHDPRFPELDNRFVVDGYKDVPFAVAFVINTVIVIILGLRNYAIGFPSLTDSFNQLSTKAPSPYATTTPAPPTLSPEESSAQLRAISSGTAVGFGLMCLMIVLMLVLLRKFTRQFITVSVAIVVSLMLFSSLFIMTESVGAGVINLVFGLIFAVWFYMIRQRIPLASIMLEWSTRVVMTFPSSFLTSIGAVITNLVFFVCWVGFVIPPLITIVNGAIDNEVQRQQDAAQHAGEENYHPPQQQMPAGPPLTFVYAMFSLYWVGQVASNVVTVTVAGLVATDYFVGGDRNGMPRNPTLASFKRAMTTSFGSICFGSLIVAIIQTIHWLAKNARNRNRNSIAAAIAVCLIELLERIMRWINKYSYCHCAIYGMGFIDASKATWALIEKSGISALINDDLVGITFSIVTLFDSLIVAGITCAFYGGNGAVFALVFVLCFFVHLLVFQCINAGVTTIFICFAESPSVIDTHKPEVRQKIDEAVLLAGQSACGGGLCNGGEDQIESGRREANNNSNRNTNVAV